MASLEDLPNEILWHIFSFLKPSFIIEVLPKVSRRFRDLVEDQSLWRRRLYSKWPTPYPTNPPDWLDCCCQREEHWSTFKHWKDGGVRRMKIQEAHIAAMDAIKLMQNGTLCVSGGRDHQLKVWKIGSEEVSLHKEFKKAHEAWIWSVEQLNEYTLASGSFDQTVKIWDMQQQNTVRTMTYPAPILSLAQQNGLVACGTAASKVHLQDSRSKDDLKCFNYHSNIVLTLAMDDKMLISGSKDGTVAFFDIRAEKVTSVVKLKGYPTAISYGNDQTWVGTSRGYVACLSANQGEAQLLLQRRISDKSVRSLNHSWGSVLVTAGDDRLIVLEPTKQVMPITRQTIPEGINKATMHDRTICAAGGSGELLVWLP